MPLIFTLSRKKSIGRLARSVEMMTHRPVMGSFLNSGKWPSIQLPAHIEGEQVLQTPYCTSTGANGKCAGSITFGTGNRNDRLEVAEYRTLSSTGCGVR